MVVALRRQRARGHTARTSDVSAATAAGAAVLLQRARLAVIVSPHTRALPLDVAARGTLTHTISGSLTKLRARASVGAANAQAPAAIPVTRPHGGITIRALVAGPRITCDELALARRRVAGERFIAAERDARWDLHARMGFWIAREALRAAGRFARLRT